MISRTPSSQYLGQSAINQDAADGGYWHQRELIAALSRWRSDPLGARLLCALFGDAILSARSAGAEPMADPSAKPDLRAWMIGRDGQSIQAHISAKLARIGSTDSPARPMHHAARVTFENASAHGLMPEHDLEARSALLSHFVDGEPLAHQGTPSATAALDHLRASWVQVARSAIEGMREPKARWLVISLAEPQADGTLRIAQTRLMSSESAIALLISEEISPSSPRDGQVGTIGNRMMHIQRGQALSLGAQRDIQIKINAAALFYAAPVLEDIPRKHVL